MNIVELLFESKLEYIAKAQGPKLEARAKQDVRKDMPASDVLQKLSAADPTGNQYKYLQWLTNQYIKGQFKLEDVSRLKGDLERFEEVSSKLEMKDINQYKTLPLLYSALEPFEGQEVVSNREADRRVEQELYASGQAKLIMQDPKVVELRSEAAAKYFGRGTKWCTAAEQDNMFDYYYHGGFHDDDEYDEDDEVEDETTHPLYVIFVDGEKFQYHPSTKQFMDAQDVEPSAARTKAIRKAHPKLDALFKDTPIHLLMKLEAFTPRQFDIDNIFDNLEKKVADDRSIVPDLDERLQQLMIKWTRGSIYKSTLRLAMLMNRLNIPIPKDAFNKVLNDPSVGIGVITAFAAFDGERNPVIEQRVLASDNPQSVLEYVRNVKFGRWPEGEQLLLSHVKDQPGTALLYAVAVGERWPELEKKFTDGEVGFKYFLDAQVQMYNNAFGTNLTAPKQD